MKRSISATTGSRAPMQPQRRLGGEAPQVLERDLGHPRDVRGEDQVRGVEQRAGERQRLDLGDVERGARQVAGAQRGGERVLVDEAAAPDVDQERAVLHLRDVDHVPRLGRERDVQRHAVGAAQQLVELDELHAGRRRDLAFAYGS